MIDHRRQGKGHGRAALALALAEMEKGMDADGHDMLAVVQLGAARL